MRMLLMGCGSGGGFNPLSLNPTLLSLPENSFSRTGGQFTAASSQYLSVASNSSVQIGDIDFWASAWFYADSLGDYCVIAKDTNASREFTVDTINGGSLLQVRFYINGSSQGIVVSTTSYAINTWHHIFAWHEPTENKLFLSVNGTLFSASTTGSPNTGSANLTIGAREFTGSNLYHNGRLDNVLFGKPPTSLGDGTSGSLAHTIATALYNSGDGLPFQSITPQQQSDWGIVSGWLDNSLTADAFGSNTLTNNNSVTQAAGKVNAVAVDNDPTFFISNPGTLGGGLSRTELANRPLYKSAGYWNVSTNQSLEANVTYGQEYTLIAVVKATDDVGNENFWDGDRTAARRQFQFAWYGANLRLTPFNTAGGTVNAEKAGTPSNWNICVGRLSGLNANVFLNGGTPGAAVLSGTPQSGAGVIVLGRYANFSSNQFFGDVAHAVLFADVALTDDQLNAYGNYLVAEYPSLSLSWTDIT